MVPLAVIAIAPNHANAVQPCDLLLVDDGRNRWSEQDHARNAFYMDALVKHIDTEQQLQPVTGVRFEVRKDLVQTVCLFQSAAQRIQIFLIHILNARCSQVIYPRLILCKCFLAKYP